MKKVAALVLCLALCMAFSVTAFAKEDITTGLILHYSFENDSATAVKDVSGKGMDGVAIDMTYADGKVGKAAVFDGETTGITATFAQPVATSTISMWIKFEDISTDGGQVFGCKEWSEGMLHCGINNAQNGKGMRINCCNFPISGTTDTALEYSLAEYALLDGTWVHLVHTYDNTTFTRAFYLNGVKIASDSGSKALAKLFAGELEFGMYSPDGTGRHIKTMMDEIRIYDRALTDAQVAALTNEEGGAGPLVTLAPTPEPTPTPIPTATPEVTQAPTAVITATTEATATPEATTAAPEPQPTTFPTWIIFVAVGVIAVVVITVLVVKKKKD